MANCRKILELYFEGISQRTISSGTGHSRNTVSEAVQRAKKLGLESLNDTMINSWLEVFLFPEKQVIEKGYFPVDWEGGHKELQKKNVTLALLQSTQQKHVGVEKSPMLTEHFVRSMGNMQRNIN